MGDGEAEAFGADYRADEDPESLQMLAAFFQKEVRQVLFLKISSAARKAKFLHSHRRDNVPHISGNGILLLVPRTST